jgi:alanine dehydrogenase
MGERIPLLDDDEISRALPMSVCIDAMHEALRALDAGDVVLPVRSVIQLPDGAGSLYTMPAFLARPRALAVKLITIFHGNEAHGLPTHQGVVVVFDADTGRPALLLDAARLTALRTAAVTAVATRALARPDAAVLAVLGTGVQARSHIDALLRVRPIRTVRVWGRDRARAELLAAEAAATAPGCTITACAAAADAVADADVVCTVTASPEPVLAGAWLRPGVHVNAIGASTAQTRELDSDAVAASRIFVDSRDAAAVEAGDLLIPLAEGRSGGPDTWTPIGAVLTGRAAGRTAPEEVTLFKSLGLAIEDAAAAAAVQRGWRAQPPP